jgi:selenocysteine lyase/cysteine desulfurase
MSETRRDFLRRAAELSLGAAGLPLIGAGAVERLDAEVAGAAAQVGAATDEQFWYGVRSAFNLSPHFVNFENGYFSPQPEAGIDEVCKDARMINEIPSYYMRRRMGEETAAVHAQLASFAGVPVEEILLTRNTTESLNIVIMGLPMERGDEALYAGFEYGSMKVAFEQRAAREGIRTKVLELPATEMDDEEIVDAYARAITDRTRVILVSHVVYLTGQVMPVRRICHMAHERGVEVIVDAAHGFAHLADPIASFGADYYAASLHKWMMAPLGTGLLHVRREKIARLWPLFGDARWASDSIQKLAHIGTRPVYQQLAVAEAIRFNATLGLGRKEARLRYLKDAWALRLAEEPGIAVHTPLEAHRSCGIGVVEIQGKDPGRVADELLATDRIFTVAPGYPGCIRVCPNIYSTLDEVRRFVEAMTRIAKA